MKTSLRRLPPILLLLALLALCSACDDDYQVFELKLTGGGPQPEARMVLVPPDARCGEYKVIVPGVVTCDDCTSAIDLAFTGLSITPFSVAVDKNNADLTRTRLLITVEPGDFCKKKWGGKKIGERPEVGKAEFDEARETLIRGFRQLRRGLMKLESNGGLAAGGGDAAVAMLSKAVPSDFTGSLHLAYGFSTHNNRPVIDLTPGMRIRVEHAVFHRKGAGVDDTFTGFITTGASDYDVARQTMTDGLQSWTVFNPFLGNLMASGAHPKLTQLDGNDDPTQVQGNVFVGGLIDLHARSQNNRYYKLFYPESMFSSTLEASTALNPGQYPVIAGADTVDELDALQPDTLAEMCGGEIPRSVCLVFRGRSAVIPQLKVRVNDAEVFVPVGTTAQQLVTRERDWPPGEMLRKVRLFRQFRDRYALVKFVGSSPMALDIPLMKGDVLTW